MNFTDVQRSHLNNNNKFLLSIEKLRNELLRFNIYSLLLSKPKLNHQLNSTEFEVRLHSYLVIHPPTTHHKLNLYTQNWEELTTAQLASGTCLYKCTVTHIPV